MRAFVALEVDDQTRTALAQIEGELQRVLPVQGLRWVRPDKIHLTLAFLGLVDREETAEVAAALNRAAEGIQPLELAVSGLGAFPGFQRPRVIWVGIEVSRELAQLQHRVAEAMRPWMEKEPEPEYHPHLTIARVSPPSQRVGGILSRSAQRYGGLLSTFGADRVVLFESAGGEYREVRSADLRRA